MTTTLAEALDRIRLALVEEATPLPGQQLSYGRPHEHPRARHFPRYSPNGERLAGSVVVRPDCPRPVKGRCECPPDGSWRPAVGVIRADATAQYATRVPASRLRLALEGDVWVDEVYEQGPDGLWRCRRPMLRALERLRGASPRRWAIAIRLIRGDPLPSVWSAHGAPPDPVGEALRVCGQLERWAQEERETDWEWRPRQWWDKPRKPKARSGEKSEAQVTAEHEPRTDRGLHPGAEAATLAPRPVAQGAPSRSQGPRATASAPEPSCA